MEVKEIITAVQTLTFEQRKELIKALFEQMPKTEPLAGSVVYVGNLEEGTQEIRKMVGESMQQTAEQLQEQKPTK